MFVFVSRAESKQKEPNKKLKTLNASKQLIWWPIVRIALLIWKWERKRRMKRRRRAQNGKRKMCECETYAYMWRVKCAPSSSSRANETEMQVAWFAADINSSDCSDFKWIYKLKHNCERKNEKLKTDNRSVDFASEKLQFFDSIQTVGSVYWWTSPRTVLRSTISVRPIRTFLRQLFKFLFLI